MALPANLTTNEVKNAAGTEVEFIYFDRPSGKSRKLIYAKSGESPSLPHRITISHDETGKGIGLTRRSLLRVDYTVLGGPDGTTPVTVSAYVVVVVPQGMLADNTAQTAALANLQSLLSTTGAATTVLFDGTGHGAAALIAGSL